MKSMTILWSPCTRMHYVPSHLTWCTLIYVCRHFLLCNRLQLGAGYTDLCSNIPGFCPGKSCNTFVPRNIKFNFSFFSYFCASWLCAMKDCLKNTVHEHHDEVIHFRQMKLYYCSICAFQRDFWLNKHDFEIVFHEKKISWIMNMTKKSYNHGHKFFQAFWYFNKFSFHHKWNKEWLLLINMVYTSCLTSSLTSLDLES